MFAVIEFKNNQYMVSPGKTISLPNFECNEKDKNVTFDKVLLVNLDNKDIIGDPTVKNSTVSAEIVEKTRTKKVRVVKFRAKKRYQRTIGQRQDMVTVKINKINLK